MRLFFTHFELNNIRGGYLVSVENAALFCHL